MAHTTTKVQAGEYTRTNGVKTVRVFFHSMCHGWMAAADWDLSLYTDILPTKKSAIENADCMLNEAKS